jgi:hypothetical protein
MQIGGILNLQTNKFELKQNQNFTEIIQEGRKTFRHAAKNAPN